MSDKNLEELVAESLEELELENLPELEVEEDPIESPNAEQMSGESSQQRLSLSDVPYSPPSADIPEGASLRSLNLLTDPNEDDFAKHLVRMGRLGVEDVLEIVDADGYIIGSKVLPHAEARYLEEVAFEESGRRKRGTHSSLSSDQLLHGILQYGSDDYFDDFDYNSSDKNPDSFGQGQDDDFQGRDSNLSGEPKSDSDSYCESDGGPLRYPTTVESLYKLIEPTREDAFNNAIKHLNRQIANIQHELCFEHKQRQILKVRKFQFEKKIILDAVSEAGILYLPGNFLHPIIGRRVKDSDIPLILETVKDIPGSDFKGFNFAYNEITDEGVTTLAQFIQEHHACIHLNLAHNDFTAEGLYTLVTYLMNRPSLQSLKIGGVKVGDEGINSITCLYMCGKGPKDIDLSELDLTMGGFQALCSAFQAVDEDDDYPNFLKKYKLPFSLEMLSRMKLENHEKLKSSVMTNLCHSHFELIQTPSPDKNRGVKEANMNWENDDVPSIDKKLPEGATLTDDITKILNDTFDTTLGIEEVSDEEKYHIDFTEEVSQAVRIDEKARNLLPTVDTFIDDLKMLKKSGCKATRPDGRPVIVCPSLYSLEIDDFTDDERASSATKNVKGETTATRVNPLYMDTLVDHEQDEEEMQKHADKEVSDTHTAEKAAVNFIKEAFQEAGATAGKSEYTHDSDMTQLLLATILESAKKFLQFESPVLGPESNELTEAELRVIWEHSLKTTANIIKPAIPAHCVVNDNILDVFVEEFLKVSSGMFYKLIQVPFFQDMFEQAATKGCIEANTKREIKALENYQPVSLTDLGYGKIVHEIVLKFLEEVIIRSAEIIGGGDPCNLRRRLGGRSNNDFVGTESWPSIVDITEEMVEPLVETFFEAGAILAQDAVTFKKEDDMNQDDGIEPAKLYLEGVFKQLSNFLYQVKDDDEKLQERREKPAKKFTFSTKPMRIVLNRPLFKGYEPVMASKLATYLRTNDSVQCLHIRKWDLREDGMINLMDGLLLNMNIVTLDLSANGIGAEGMRPLGEYIKRNLNLKHLLLNHNRLRNPGIKILTNSIPESNLVSLNVAFNDVSEGLNPFLEAVGKSNIYSLYVLGNCLNHESCLLLKDLFDTRSLRQEECDVEVQEIDGEAQIVKNSQARDVNEWYEVPAQVDLGLVCPPFYQELYTPPKVTIFGAVDVQL